MGVGKEPVGRAAGVDGDDEGMTRGAIASDDEGSDGEGSDDEVIR